MLAGLTNRFFSRQNVQLSWLSIIILGLLPWGLVSFGLYILKNYRWTLALYEICGCLLPVIVLQGFSPLKTFMGPAFHKRLALWSIFCGNLLLLSVWPLVSPVIIRWKSFLPTLQLIHLNTLPSQIVFAACLIFANPILEEQFWRGLLYQQMKQKSNPYTANIFSSILFGAWHWVILQALFEPFAALGVSMIIMVVGIILAFIYEKTGRLLEPIVIHSLAGDLPAMILFFSALKKAAALTA